MYSITSCEEIYFWASNKSKTIINDSSEEDDTKYENRDNFKKKSNEIFSNQDF